MMKKRLQWYQKAAKRGNVKAQFNLAAMYDNGEGVMQDKEKAVQWYQKAAKQGKCQSPIQSWCDVYQR